MSGQPEREETDVFAGTSRLASEEPRETAAMSGVSWKFKDFQGKILIIHHKGSVAIVV